MEVCARFANVADNIDKWILIAGVLRVAIVLFLAAFLFRKNIHYVTKMVLITAIYATIAYVSPFYRLIPIIVVVGALASESVRPRDRLVRLLLVFLVVAPLPSPVVFNGSTAMIQLIRLPSLLLLCGILIASEFKDKRRLIR